MIHSFYIVFYLLFYFYLLLHRSTESFIYRVEKINALINKNEGKIHNKDTRTNLDVLREKEVSTEISKGINEALWTKKEHEMN